MSQSQCSKLALIRTLKSHHADGAGSPSLLVDDEALTVHGVPPCSIPSLLLNKTWNSSCDQG